MILLLDRVYVPTNYYQITSNSMRVMACRKFGLLELTLLHAICLLSFFAFTKYNRNISNLKKFWHAQEYGLEIHSAEIMRKSKCCPPCMRNRFFLFIYLFFFFGFTALSSTLHLYRADCSSKVGENPRTQVKIAIRGDSKSPDQTAISKFSVFQSISWIY